MNITDDYKVGHGGRFIITTHCCGSGCAKYVVDGYVVEIVSTDLQDEGIDINKNGFSKALALAQNKSIHELLDILLNQKRITQKQYDEIMKKFKKDHSEFIGEEDEAEPVVDGEPINVTKELEKMNERKLTVEIIEKEVETVAR